MLELCPWTAAWSVLPITTALDPACIPHFPVVQWLSSLCLAKTLASVQKKDRVFRCCSLACFVEVFFTWLKDPPGYLCRLWVKCIYVFSPLFSFDFIWHITAFDSACHTLPLLSFEFIHYKWNPRKSSNFSSLYFFVLGKPCSSVNTFIVGRVSSSLSLWSIRQNNL